ncbi:molybdopterin synthase sulfurylase [Cryptosporidium ryanae]|uniref:molybdopterin synthase sulfurylase n=1 Tax=Cryptosporidium ryanae TaxID=515981 RepID=UPI00351A60ED|nr:molybdopterin synthase sulfurylase [Cryptosporidium ryanae]
MFYFPLFDWTVIGFCFLSIIVSSLFTAIFFLWNSNENRSTKSNIFRTTNNPSLSEENVIRYSRQIALKEVGVSGQVKLKESKVLVIGAGGLGSPILLYLTGAGIGVIGIVDNDVVSLSNLHRQVIHSTLKNDMNKALSARETCNSLNPNTRIVVYQEPLSIELAKEIFPHYDIIVDSTDNCRSRYLINDAAVYYNKPVVSGAALKWQGHVTIYNYLDGPCYRCIAPREDNGKVDGTPGGAETFGVLGMMVGIIGCMQATEVIKLILNGFKQNLSKTSENMLPVLSGKMLFYNSLSKDNIVRLIDLRRKNKNCKTCGENPVPFFLLSGDCYKVYKGMEMVRNSFYSFPDSRFLTSKNIEQVLEDVKKMNKKLDIFDVRPINLFEISHITGSKNIPEDSLLEKLAQFDIHINSNTGEIKSWNNENNKFVKDYLIKTFNISEDKVMVFLCFNGVRSFFVFSILQQCFEKLDMKLLNYYLYGGISSIRSEFLTNFPNL